MPKWSVVLFFWYVCVLHIFLYFHFSLWLHIYVVLFCCIVVFSCVFFVVLPVSFCSAVLCLILPSHVLLSRFGLALSAFNLSYDFLFCSCRYRLPLCVAFSLRFLRIVFCRSLLLSRFSALRVSPAETRLTVYRRLSIWMFCGQAAIGCMLYESLGQKTGRRFIARITL